MINWPIRLYRKITIRPQDTQLCVYSKERNRMILTWKSRLNGLESSGKIFVVKIYHHYLAVIIWVKKLRKINIFPLYLIARLKAQKETHRSICLKLKQWRKVFVPVIELDITIFWINKSVFKSSLNLRNICITIWRNSVISLQKCFYFPSPGEPSCKTH